MTGREIPRALRGELNSIKTTESSSQARPHVATVFQEERADVTKERGSDSKPSSVAKIEKPDVKREATALKQKEDVKQQPQQQQPQQQKPQQQPQQQPQHTRAKSTEAPDQLDVVRDEGTGPPPVVIYSSLQLQQQQERIASRTLSDRSDVSTGSSGLVTSPTQAKRSAAILARAAYWDERISTGESSDQRANIEEFPAIPDEVFHR